MIASQALISVFFLVSTGQAVDRELDREPGHLSSNGEVAVECTIIELEYRSGGRVKSARSKNCLNEASRNNPKNAHKKYDTLIEDGLD